MMYTPVDVPFELHEIKILEADDDSLTKMSEELGLGLSLDEMKRIKEHFHQKGRNPMDIEIQSLGQAWSEHCCYKSSKYYLKQSIVGLSADYVISAIEEDAGVAEFDEEHAYVLALESHNHPSAIEPYGGAATGIGGILRDVLCMGAQPIALIDPLYFGNPHIPGDEVPSGTKHPLYLLSGVVEGIRDYGNRVGIPTVSGSVFFDHKYLTNCIVNVGCVGIVKKDQLIHSRAGNAGDIFILAGGPTGRDGIHGVTFASSELHERSEEESRGAVQLGNPIIKEPLIHSCLEIVDKGLLTGMKDLGGGGLSCVIGEMASAAGFGAEVHLEKVHLKERNMAPWEMWVSESQERMMLTVEPKHVDQVLYIFQKWDVPATIVGTVTSDKDLKVHHHGHKIYHMDINFVTSAVEYCRAYSSISKEVDEEETTAIPEDYRQTFVDILSHPNVASKEWVIRQYDHEVRASTVLKPLHGRINSEGHGDASVIKPITSNRGISLSVATNPWLVRANPYWGTASVFDQLVRNLVAVNSIPHSFADGLNYGNPEKPERMGEFVDSTEAMGWMARDYGMPCLSGNVSLYNETSHGSIPPTPTLVGVGIVEDVSELITSDFKYRGNAVVLVGDTQKEFGGSVYSQINDMKGVVPRTSPEKLKEYADAMLESFKRFDVRACHDISNGGMAAAIGEMSIGSGMGVSIDLSEMGDEKETYTKLFSESNTRWLVEVKQDEVEDYIQFFTSKQLIARHIGTIGGDSIEFRDGDFSFNVAVEDAEEAWRKGLTKYIE
ncbi:MAG: phosphoribosylformylglycinamidine synthase subunit PurL [Archaeoglobaceae archaeon]